MKSSLTTALLIVRRKPQRTIARSHVRGQVVALLTRTCEAANDVDTRLITVVSYITAFVIIWRTNRVAKICHNALNVKFTRVGNCACIVSTRI